MSVMDRGTIHLPTLRLILPIVMVRLQAGCISITATFSGPQFVPAGSYLGVIYGEDSLRIAEIDIRVGEDLDIERGQNGGITTHLHFTGPIPQP